jgi:hypothetical protein
MSELRAGEWVEVRSKQEILRSLDKNGRLDGLPFMPQMFQYCGQRFRVFKRAHKTCDPVWGRGVGRRLSNGVHLDLRCDGKAYGGCQAACLIFWKEAWLKPVSEKVSSLSSSVETRRESASVNEPSCTESDVWTGTRAQNQPTGNEPQYVCQATQLLDFTTQLPWYDARQYVEDYFSGNASLGRILRGFVYVCYHYGTLAYRGRSGAPARYPRRRGTIRAGEPTPVARLNLQPGELVRVKPFQEILATIDTNLRNRGLGFDAELVPFCGGTYRVKAKVGNFVDEKTGRMKTLKTPAVILEGVYCQSRYSYCRMFCPRSIYSWWREVWLERVDEDVPGDTVSQCQHAAHKRDAVQAVQTDHTGASSR